MTVLPHAVVIKSILNNCKKYFTTPYLKIVVKYSFEIYLIEYFVRKIIVLDSLGKLVVLFSLILVLSAGLNKVYGYIKKYFRKYCINFLKRLLLL